MKVLIVEDNELLGSGMKRGLEENGFLVDLARNGEEAHYFATNSEYHLLLVDRMLPKLSGTQLIARLRAEGSHVPVIMVTARGSIEDRISGLDSGADDYLVKPFAMGELIARLNALYRRSQGRGTSELAIGDLTVDPAGRWASIGGVRLDLTSKEFDLLACLAERAGQVVSRNELHGRLYELNEEPESNSLNVLLARLRRKLACAGVEIATIRRQGFILRAETSSSQT